MLFTGIKPGMLRDVAQLFSGDRPPRRILFQENKPASLPGWALLDVG